MNDVRFLSSDFTTSGKVSIGSTILSRVDFLFLFFFSFFLSFT